MTQPTDYQPDLFAQNSFDAPSAPDSVAAREGGGGGGAGEGQAYRLKEKILISTSFVALQPAAPAVVLHGWPEPSHTIRPWPAALNWSCALEYTSFSPRSLRRAESDGQLTFKRVGPNGRKVIDRRQLDELLLRTFDAHRRPIEEDFDFG